MRVLLVGFVALLGAAHLLAEPPARRHGVEADLKSFPQGTPQEALASVLKATDLRRIDYVLAHLADPQFVDRRVKESAGGFAALVRETTGKLVEDPTAVKLLRRFLKEGEWTAGDDAASVRLKDVADRSVTFRKADGRWVMENPYRPKPKRQRE
jgi:hypothetical protein